MRGRPLDIHGLHVYLWKRTDSYDQIRINQRDLAAKMMIAHETLSRTFKKMVDEGRIKKVRSSQHRVNTYRVTEPDFWLEQKQAEEQQDD